MRFVPEGATVKRALSAHAAIGLLAGALLYIVCLSGTLLVFYEEWQVFEQASPPQMTSIDPGAVQRGIAAVMETEQGKPATTHLYVDMPVDEIPTTRIITDTQAVHVDAQGRIVGPEEIQWSNFLYGLHYTLNVPLMDGVVGLTLVGILGMLIVALAMSGVIAHPKIFRDAFRLRARHSGGVALADWHNRLSVWTLPFTLAIAITGAVVGLSTVTATALGAIYYDGDTEAFYATMFGEEGEPNPAPAPLPNVAAALRYMGQNYPDLRLTYVTVHEPGTAGQHVQIIAEHPRRLIFGEYYMFDAAGQFEGTAGLANGELGQQAAASNYYLHFGSYGGLPVKIAYALGGLALTVICATGIYIWIGKRRRRGFEEPRLYAAWSGLVWGAPISLAITLAVRLTIGSGAPFAAIFWTSLVVIVFVSVARAGYGRRVFERRAAARA